MTALLALAGLFSPLLAGCGELGYYRQAISGHFSIMRERTPIVDAVADPDTPATLRAQISEAHELREFAIRELRLPDNGSYRTYVDLGRPYVTWNVFAAERFSVVPQQWCFPFAGCVPYRGYFREQDAREYGQAMAEQGFDVYIGGATAYSSLGWFDDPILNTMLDNGSLALAETLFHELAHQQVYVADDTAFNESFAVAVQEFGVERWLTLENRPDMLAAYRAAVERRTGFADLVAHTRDLLRQAYDDPAADPAQKKEAKQRILAEMRRSHKALKREWGGYAGYDHWFDGDLNNARLASVAVYRDHVPAFHRLLALCDHRPDRFYETVARLGEWDSADREVFLREAGACDPCSTAASDPCPKPQQVRGSPP